MSLFVPVKFFCRLMAFVSIAFAGSAFAVGIEFEHGSWQEVVEKAKSENKLIFVDVYTDWCGPCMQMAKETFPQQEVGEFFNKRFVSFKLNAEEGEGEDLSARFSVAAYPTLLFVTADEAVVYRATGYKDANELIKLAQAAINPDVKLSPLSRMDGEFNDGEVDREFAAEYFKAIREAKGSADFKLGQYLEKLDEETLLAAETYDFIETYASNYKGKPLEILINRFPEFSQLVGEQRIMDKLSKVFVRSHSHHVGAGFAERFVNVSVVDYLKKSNYPHKDRLLMEMDINFLGNCRKDREMLEAIVAYFDKYGIDNVGKASEYLQSAANIVEDADMVRKLIVINNKLLASGLMVEKLYFSHAVLCSKAGQPEQAVKSAKSYLASREAAVTAKEMSFDYWKVAQVYQRIGENAEAIALARKSLELNGDDGSEYFREMVNNFIGQLSK